MIDASNERPVAGFLSPPHWCDPSPEEFRSICAKNIATQQAMIPLYNFPYGTIANVAGAFPEMLATARLLGSAGCDVIASTGTPFGWAGTDTEALARSRNQLLSETAGVPVVMAGLAIIDALKALGATRVAISTPYYNEEWRIAWGRIVKSSGISVLAIQSMDQQNLVPKDSPVDDHGWAMTSELIEESVRRAVKSSPGAQAAIITGAGSRTLTLTPGLERELGIPVLASDTALYWSLAERLGVPLKDGCLGSLSEA